MGLEEAHIVGDWGGDWGVVWRGGREVSAVDGWRWGRGKGKGGVRTLWWWWWLLDWVRLCAYDGLGFGFGDGGFWRREVDGVGFGRVKELNIERG